jgi:ATP-dependent Lon protease
MYRKNSDDAESPGFTRITYGSDALLVPEQVLHEIQQEKESAQRSESEKPAIEADDPVIDEPLPVCEILNCSEPFAPATYSVETFSEAAIQRAVEESKQQDRETQSRIKASIAVAKRQNGCRLIPEIEPDLIEGIVTALRRRFPNFRNVIDHLETELSLAMASTPEAFRLGPILLHGSPGVGKTAFSMAFAKMMGVGFDRISAAGMQGSFELVGTSSHWANSGPGKVFNLVAGGNYASPVLVIDEIDKVASDERYPIVPALLELLEPVSARDFMDQSMGLRFDASKIISIATANDLSSVPGPLLSRLHAIEVSTPTIQERRYISVTIFDQTVKGLILELAIQDDALDHLATAPIDIRAIGRLVRDAIGRVIRAGRDVVGIDDIRVPSTPSRPRAGFV